MITLKIVIAVLLFTCGNSKSTKTFLDSEWRKLQKNICYIRSMTCSQPLTLSESMIQLGYCKNHLYVVPFHRGFPEQLISCIVATNSNYLWVLKNRQKVDFNSKFPDNNAQFEFQLMKNKNAISEIKSNIDLMHMDEDIRNQLVNINQLKSKYLQKSGIFGVLGSNTLSKNSNKLDITFQNSDILKSMYTFSLRSNDGPSFLYYNQIPQQILNNSTFIQAFSFNIYELQLIYFGVDGHYFQGFSSNKILLSPSTHYFQLTTTLYNKVVSSFFQQCTPSCRCTSISAWPTFVLTLSTIQLYIHPQNYIKSLSYGKCTYGFTSNENNEGHLVFGSSLFHSYNITFNQLGHTVGFQGEQTEVASIGTTFFMVSQYISMSLIIIFSFYAAFMLWKLRVIKNQKYSRMAQISLSSRFLDGR